MASVLAPLPRMTIQFCTQCKWMLRAAYVGLEFLTFSLYSCCDLSQVLVSLVLILSCGSSCSTRDHYFIGSQWVHLLSISSQADDLTNSSHKNYSQHSRLHSEKLRFNLQQAGHSLFPYSHQVLRMKAISKLSIISSGIERQKEGSLVCVSHKSFVFTAGKPLA
jgi:hypothetical protein